MQSTPVLSTRTRCFVLALGLASISGLQSLSAAVPSNDTCATAQVIPPGLSSSNIYFTPTIPDIREATLSGDPVLEVCVVPSELSRSVWYQFTPATTGGYTFSTGPDTASTLTGFDPIIAVYQSTGCGSAFTQVACNDDTGGGVHNLAGVHANLTSGTSYYVVVWTGGASDFSQPLALQLKVSRPTVPSNDACAGAILVQNSFPYASPAIDVSLATTTPGLIPSCTPATGIPSRDVWFRFQPPSTATYIFSTGADSVTTVDDTLMAIFSGDCGNLTPVICNDNTIGRAATSVLLNQGTTYYIALYEVLEDLDDEFTPGHTLMQLRISPASAPTVGSVFASSIASTNVLLNGTVNPNGLQSRFWFEWGPTTSLGSTSAVRLILGGTASFPTNLNVSGFAPNTTHHFKMVATNLLGRSESPLATFRWLSTPPQISVFQRPTANRAYLRFDNGNPNQLYSVQSATLLGPPNAWTHVGFAVNPVAGPSNVFEFNHTGIGANPSRFYRIHLP